MLGRADSDATRGSVVPMMRVDMRLGAARSACGAALAICVTFFAGCGSEHPDGNAAMIDLKPIETSATVGDWHAVSGLKIAFGHQSVGADVIDGIELLARETGVPMSIKATRNPLSAPALHHFAIGENGAPDSKLLDFSGSIAETIGGSADVAFMKLCYVDFNGTTDANELARKYISTLESLSLQFPNTTFVALTAPLTTVQSGPKALVKKLLGRHPAGYEGNASRKVFNDAVRSRYGDSNRLFDIAAIESGFGRHRIEYDGKLVEVLDPALTYDGGHLNDRGKRLVAGALVHHLAAFSLPTPAGEP